MNDTYDLLRKILISIWILALVFSVFSVENNNLDYTNSYNENQKEMQVNDSDTYENTEQTDIPETTPMENKETDSNNNAAIILIAILTVISISSGGALITQKAKKKILGESKKNNVEVNPDKMQDISAKIIKMLNEKFGEDSLTYGKYESVINIALAQYNKNVQEISSYKALKKEVSKSKKEKIQPKIDELKQKNNDLISNLEDLYISLSIEDKNETDNKIQNLQEAIEQLKYYNP